MKFNRLFWILIQIFAFCLLICDPLLAGTITVNTGANLSDSGQNDIELIQGYCDSTGRSSRAVGDTAASYMAQLEVKTLRGINLDNTDNGSQIDSQGFFIPSSTLDSALKDFRKYGYAPHVIVGQQVPKFLKDQFGDAWNWNANAWDIYKNYALGFVRYVVYDFEQGSGFFKSVFEVTNEVDVDDTQAFIWTVENSKVNASSSEPLDPEPHLRRYGHLVKMFEIWQAAVTQVASEHPDRIVQIAGPAITQPFAPTPAGAPVGVNLNLPNWRDTFIDAVADNNWRLDNYTFHFYGDKGMVGNAAAVPYFNSLKEQIQAAQEKLSSRGRGNTPVTLTEWGPSANTSDVKYSGRINYSHEGAAWTVAFLKDAVSKALSDAIFLLIRDDIDFKPENLAFPSFLHFRDSNGNTLVESSEEYPKPVYNVCKMFTLLPGTRKSVDALSAQPNLLAVAAANSDSAGVVVANYSTAFSQEIQDPNDPNKKILTNIDQSVDEPVIIQFNGLPFSGRAIVQQYLIDANTSNLAKYLDAGQVPDSSGTQLQKISDTEVDVTNGLVSLPQIILGKSAVSLWVIQSKK
jgi:xylan 1,4-beta-xylosidase